MRPLLFGTLCMTLSLLWLGSMVHATGSSLACPDWPTCFGTMMPNMVGGIFWEHLHRLWAGGLVLLFLATTIVVRWQLPHRGDLFGLGLAGCGLLLVQSLLGGLTVLFRLPDALSTAHLGLAFIFVALVTTMLVQSRRPGGAGGWAGDGDTPPGGVASRHAPAAWRRARRAGTWTAGLLFLQSLVGALVRHTDAGMACPDVPLCLGRWVPPLDHPLVQLHFTHRVLGVVIGIGAFAVGWRVWRTSRDALTRRLAALLATGIVTQVILGFVSVAARLEAPFVSVHTLLAATLLALAVGLATHARDNEPRPAP